MAYLATSPPKEYPITLNFVIFCPLIASSSSVSSISLVTRSPPNSMPS